MKSGRVISSATQLCAVIGNPIAHSLSPAIHNAAYEALGLDYVYTAFQVEDLGGALAGMRALKGFRGMSVTIPHKIEAMKHVDEIEEVDRSIGSINTVVNESGRLLGLGTDGPGALQAIDDAGVEIDGAQILFLGAGGAARAVAFTLANRRRPGGIDILDVDEGLMGRLRADLEADGSTPVAAAPLGDRPLAKAMEKADLIVNCTPVGMRPREAASLVPPGLFREGQTVFDIVYTPLETKLLADARSRGLKVISGVEMFINQACLQFDRFTGVEAPVEVMRRVVMEHLQA